MSINAKSVGVGKIHTDSTLGSKNLIDIRKEKVPVDGI